VARKSTVRLLAVFAAMIVVISIALFWESLSGPTFRASDHASLEECLESIPGEWARGSIEYIRASEACAWQHPPPGSRR
jgi:hypothetical protein